jgi:hypothetical protein
MNKYIILVSCVACVCQGKTLPKEYDDAASKVLAQLLFAQSPGVRASASVGVPAKHKMGGAASSYASNVVARSNAPRMQKILIEFKDADDTACKVVYGETGYDFYLDGSKAIMDTKVASGVSQGKEEGSLFFWGMGGQALITNVEDSVIEKVLAAGIPDSPPPAATQATKDPGTLDFGIVGLAFSGIMFLIVGLTVVVPYVTK